MGLLTKQQIENITQAVGVVEQASDVELVTVLARRADNYYYIPMLWAALFALLVPAVLLFTPFWLEDYELLVAQWITFIVVAGIFRIPVVMMKLVPKNIKHWRAASLARCQFFENNLHHTDRETGFLIFVSEAERYVEIIVDRGISQHIDDSQWQVVVDRFLSNVKAGRTEEGFIECIEQCGQLLKMHVPSFNETNQLPNRFIVL